MDSPLILVIDDSQTIRKLVECHLSQAGYRVAMACNAEEGLAAAEALSPTLILLDHQLPGTTGDEVCRQLLASESTARIPVIVSSAMRNRAFASYTDYPNVVDQIPKPFTPELLKSGVANALQTGAMVVQAQRTGCAIPEAVGEVHGAILEGDTSAFPLRAIFDFLNNNQQSGRLTLEIGKDRYRFALGSGRIQAVFSPTITPDRIVDRLPPELSDVAPLLAVTLGERQDASMSGLVKLVERSLSDPRRLRALLRVQAAVLTHDAIQDEPVQFFFEREGTIPPMFQAFPLQISLAALAVEGVRHCEPIRDASPWADRIFARSNPRGGNLDRVGLTPAEMKAHALLDGTHSLGSVAEKTGLSLVAAAELVRGLERLGLAEQRHQTAGVSVLLVDEDPEVIRVVQSTLGPEGLGCGLKIVRDRVGAQLLMRKGSYDLVLIGIDKPEKEAFVRSCKENDPGSTRIIGIVPLADEEELARLDAMGLDGVLIRPLAEDDLLTTVTHLQNSREPVEAA